MVKSYFAICILIPLLAFAGVGCAKASHANDSQGVRPTVVSINGNIGRGVLLSNSPTGSVFLLTARHVATYRGCFKRDLRFDFECRSGKRVIRRLIGGKCRWLTTAKPGLDLAWIRLREDELPARDDFVCADIESFSEETLVSSVDKEVFVADCRGRKAVYLGNIFAKDVELNDNQSLLCVTQKIGCLNVGIEKSESGSPVFGLSEEGRYTELIGLVTVGCKTGDKCGFIPVLDIADKLQDNFRGFFKTRLCDCKELW